MEGDAMKREGRAIDRKRADRLDEAADWLLRLEEPSRAEADYTDWLRWCDSDPENLAAFETVQHKWQAFDALKADPELSKFASLPDSRTQGIKLDLTLTAAQKRALLDQEADRLFGAFPHRGLTSFSRIGRGSEGLKRTRVWAIAAGVGALAIALAVFHYRSTPTVAPAQQVAAALTNRAATLPDGSRMILGTQSRVDVNFNGPKRQLDLSSGEAYFKVKHDKSRPFVVRAGEVSVTAIGTAFDVRRDHDRITVTVEEGVVEISSSSRNTWRAEAGYQLTYSTNLRTASIASVNPSAELAWRNGELAYLYEPLGSVVDDLNRYSGHRIVIADNQVAQIPFTGTAFATSLDGWLAGVEQAYPITVNRTASGDIVLSSRE